MASYAGTRSFSFANFRNKGSVSLEFTVESKVDISLFQDFNSLLNLINGFTSAGSLRGIGQEGNADIFDTQGITGTDGAARSNISKLFSCRVKDNTAVTEDQFTALTKVGVA